MAVKIHDASTMTSSGMICQNTVAKGTMVYLGRGQLFGARLRVVGPKHLTAGYLRSNHSCGTTLGVFARGIEVD